MITAQTQIKFNGVIGTNNPNIDQKELVERLLDMETEFNQKKQSARLHLFIAENENEEMEVGDMVESKDLKACILASGSGIYDTAMVFSIDPFRLISENGDMIWTQENKKDFRVVGKANIQTAINAISRLVREYED